MATSSKIAVLTYAVPHRKTQDTLARLSMCGYRDTTVVAIPFVERKKFSPRFRHRPSTVIPVAVEETCRNLGYRYQTSAIDGLDAVFRRERFRHILITGAGLLPEGLVKEFQLTNSHPGYLPLVKGLDALKWAIYNDNPIGVTSHYVSETTDEGILIERREVPVYREDTFHAIAYRQYEMEIAMLVDAIARVEAMPPAESLSNPDIAANRRMPKDLEGIMWERCLALIARSPSLPDT